VRQLAPILSLQALYVCSVLEIREESRA